MDKNIIIHLSEQVSTESGKWYKVLAVGDIHSQKYNGVWDANPEIYMNEEKEGIIKVHENFIDALINNFKINANETLLFVDENHDQKISFGPIKDMKKDNWKEKPALFIQPEWNDIGVDAVANKHYMYLSIGISGHKSSKTGDWIFPVANTTSLTNIPVDKDQDVIELSDKTAPVGKKADKSKNKKGGTSMGIDAILEKIAELKDMIASAVEGDSGTVAKAAIGAAIDELEVSCGLATEEEEAGEGEEMQETLADGTPNPNFKKKTAPATPAATAPAVGTNMSDHLDFIALSDKNKALEGEVKALRDVVELSEFRKISRNKIIPADEKKYFAKWQADKVFMSDTIAKFPDLGLTTRRGSGDDIEMSDASPEKARQIWDNAVIEMADTKKISTIDAVEILKNEKPQLFALAYPVKA
jgi:phage I-like protein